MPAHYGRRCTNQELVNGQYERCLGRWSFKVCNECETENDIAARYCTNCKSELVDPNTKLKLDFQKIKSSATSPTSDKVLSWNVRKWISKAGNESIRIDYTTEYRTFPIWYSPDSKSIVGRRMYKYLVEVVYGMPLLNISIDEFINDYNLEEIEMVTTITSVKKGDFFTALAYNREETTYD